MLYITVVTTLIRPFRIEEATAKLKLVIFLYHSPCTTTNACDDPETAKARYVMMSCTSWFNPDSIQLWATLGGNEAALLAFFWAGKSGM